MGFIYEPGQGMTEPQIKQGNRLINLVTPRVGSTFFDEQLATDDHTYTNIGNTEATATEIVGTASVVLRVSFFTQSNITSTWAEFHSRFNCINRTGTTESFTTAGQYGTGASPSSWTNTEIFFWPNVLNNFGFTHDEFRHFGSGASIALLPNTTYTFRAVVWCNTIATADVENFDGTFGSFRRLLAILHPF